MTTYTTTELHRIAADLRATIIKVDADLERAANVADLIDAAADGVIDAGELQEAINAFLECNPAFQFDKATALALLATPSDSVN